MRAVLLSLLVATSAFAADDAPLKGLGSADGATVLGQTQLDVAPIEQGEPAPGAGCWLSTEMCLAQGKRVKACEAERDELRAMPNSPTGLIIALSVGLGVAAGFLIGRVTK